MADILKAESKAVTEIPFTEDYNGAVEAIVEHVNRRGGKLVTAGMGKAGQIAMNIATTFSSTGTPAVNLHPSEAQHGDLGVLQPNDIMLLISNSGKTREIIELVDLVKGIYPEMPFIVITGAPDIDHCHDSHRRYSRRQRHESHRLHPRRICQAPPRRLSRQRGPRRQQIILTRPK